MRQAGLEPARDCSHYPLEVACTPISPLSHICCCAGRIRTSDFQVMSLTSYLCSTAQAGWEGYEPTTYGLRTVMEYRPPYCFRTVWFRFFSAKPLTVRCATTTPPSQEAVFPERHRFYSHLTNGIGRIVKSHFRKPVSKSTVGLCHATSFAFAMSLAKMENRNFGPRGT